MVSFRKLYTWNPCLLMTVSLTVKTPSYILKKYAKCPPSLVLHLHPTHFRFEQQDGSFPYNSEMKVIIEHIRAGTVPHDMIEELLRANVRFYEGRLPTSGYTCATSN
jgi:transcription factor SPT20